LTVIHHSGPIRETATSTLNVIKEIRMKWLVLPIHTSLMNTRNVRTLMSQNVAKTIHHSVNK
jgi:hypothetical protein